MFRLLYDPTLTSIHNYWETRALTILTFVGKVMSLLFNRLSKFVIASWFMTGEGQLMPVESACNVGDLGWIPGLGRSSGGGHDNQVQYSCLENPHGQRSLVGYSPGVAKSRT